MFDGRNGTLRPMHFIFINMLLCVGDLAKETFPCRTTSSEVPLRKPHIPLPCKGRRDRTYTDSTENRHTTGIACCSLQSALFYFRQRNISLSGRQPKLNALGDVLEREVAYPRTPCLSVPPCVSPTAWQPRDMQEALFQTQSCMKNQSMGAVS